MKSAEGIETTFPPASPGITASLADAVAGKRPLWTTQELVTIGVFAAVIKASTLLVAYAGGGMNPVTLLAKNFLYATLMIALLHKVPRTWTMTLAVGMTSLVSLLLMGQGILHGPAMVAACLLGEGAIFLMGGYGKTRNIVVGVLVAELAGKVVALSISWLVMREQPGMLASVTMFVIIGAFGTLIGAVMGVRFIKELRHAGIISH